MLLFIVDDVTLADDEIVVERDGGATSEKVGRSKDVIEFAKKHGEGHVRPSASRRSSLVGY